jgi:uncharacterized protein (DUF849 family)
MLLQATLNGELSKTDHPAVPVSIEELIEDAVACVSSRARAFHLHPRDEAGEEQLDAATVDMVVAAVRGRHGYPVGVTTGAWIEPDVVRRGPPHTGGRPREGVSLAGWPFCLPPSQRHATAARESRAGRGDDSEAATSCSNSLQRPKWITGVAFWFSIPGGS